jgi:hypothetical protein
LSLTYSFSFNAGEYGELSASSLWGEHPIGRG